MPPKKKKEISNKVVPKPWVLRSQGPTSEMTATQPEGEERLAELIRSIMREELTEIKEELSGIRGIIKEEINAAVETLQSDIDAVRQDTDKCTGTRHYGEVEVALNQMEARISDLETSKYPFKREGHKSSRK